MVAAASIPMKLDPITTTLGFTFSSKARSKAFASSIVRTRNTFSNAFASGPQKKRGSPPVATNKFVYFIVDPEETETVWFLGSTFVTSSFNINSMCASSKNVWSRRVILSSSTFKPLLSLTRSIGTCESREIITTRPVKFSSRRVCAAE
eukprot:Lithocolla_globosa_v1_NODE_2993_length_1802_cov_15.983400.p2 type:complete len:149 gc:universal NODE_2993_length_1802_cov_15.983400:888-442(-)